MTWKGRKFAIALDFQSRDEAWAWVETFQSLPVVLKFGLRLLPYLKSSDFEALKDLGFEIFIDAKLHDIPSQVAGAVRTWSELGADYLTLHLSGGEHMIHEAVQACGPQTTLLGVSVLTSLGEKDLKALGVSEGPVETVSRWVNVGLKAGLQAFVCSVGESHQIHQLGNAETRTVCPGIRFEGQPAGDQSRVYTPQEAFQQQVDMLVLGRALLKDSDPRVRLEKLLGASA